ncbi:hypothetical protein [Alkalihalobacillus pseudalcaliphilus]|uniref:hypothetical protein n=1 Tax=Alkalihalobacillus pseudalcaliphilus TaxID=79884 RepID=UPI00064DF533|nr:hypothetical protein [Alkalihalobacillus pseudalcaliphilus]KMK75788.1 hypothetical protein AB990_11000 [Alkalihalobacillus pseudalcaliphilus]
MKLHYFIVILLVVMFVPGCVNDGTFRGNEVIEDHTQQNKSNDREPSNSNSEIKKSLSYEEFETLFHEIKDHLKVEGYEVKSSTTGIDLTVVDKDLTFGSRDWLTVDGEFHMDNGSQSTQNSIFLENEQSSKLISVVIAYTESYMGEDMVYYLIDNDYPINQNLAQTTDLVTISYKNLIITVLQTADSQAENEETQKILRGVLEFLE